ncbi:helix-turn-helix domain-containing protein [Aquimarina sp. MMG016]|uniref:helix-turn-helix domain-containing protein n=1 Tax=Aquimarina sp. MMG016 TaxID=2822690 RepID=UPI001B3A15E4|nr:helix-turn-helix domain-containing protein [Aquimarina sp. MMG016]MBQ4818863.1 helix-turn-helix domain-containing protein [Aquimarina sp. MMG016]
MEIIVFESEAYKKLQSDIMQMMRTSIREAKEEALANMDPANDWLSAEEAKKLLGIKSKTKLQELRDCDEIVFSKAGRVIKYSKKSILDYLNRHIVRYS